MNEQEKDYTDGAKNFVHHMWKNRIYQNMALIVLILIGLLVKIFQETPDPGPGIFMAIIALIWVYFIIRSYVEFREMKKGIKR